MIFEGAFDDLVKKIGRQEAMDVGVGKVSGERLAMMKLELTSKR